jgi:hypothetical protein
MDKGAYRNGAADAILGIPSRNPYGYKQLIKMRSYNSGYAHGEFVMGRGLATC